MIGYILSKFDELYSIEGLRISPGFWSTIAFLIASVFTRAERNATNFGEITIKSTCIYLSIYLFIYLFMHNNYHVKRVIR